MLNWSTPDINIIGDGSWRSDGLRRFGSDTAPANMILLGEKYNIRTAVSDGVLFRYYNGSKPNRRGYGFPLYGGNADHAKLFELIKDDAEAREIPLSFCLCDERQRSALDMVCRVDWECTDDDSDYIYKRESLAALSGKKLHRKRNHINIFSRLYDDFEYRPLDSSNCQDALSVAEQWLAERGDSANPDERAELECIRTALVSREKLGLFGGVLYVGDTPAAMTVASAISEAVTDVHYEKAFGEYAENGAFTVINQCFASSVTSEYINREEDMGIAGLRTAKESYYPAFKLKKYYGVCKC